MGQRHYLTDDKKLARLSRKRKIKHKRIRGHNTPAYMERHEWRIRYEAERGTDDPT